MAGDQDPSSRRSAFAKVISRLKNHTWAVLTVVVLVTGVFIINVSHKHSGSSATAQMSSSAGAASTSSTMIQGAADTSQSALVSTTPKGYSNQSSTRMIIEQATLNVATPDVHTAASKIEQLTVNDGGFVQSLTESSAESGSALNLTLRIPETDFQSFLSTTRGMGTVKSFSQTGQDVTQQFDDLENNLTELKNESTAYIRLYNKAQSMQDMLEIQKSLTQVNNQIADIQTQEHTLSRAVRLSTINLTLTEEKVVSGSKSPVVHALLQSLNAIKYSALGLVTFVAWLLPWSALLVIVWVGIHLWRKKKSKT